MRIISLSTIPPRFATLGLTLESLVSQSGAIDEIILYIPKTYRRFPDYDGSLPSVPDGVKIVRPDCDLGPASKVLFAAREFRNHHAQLLFCDDDKIFSRTWAESLFNAQSDRPGECVALIGKPLLPSEGTPSALLPKAVRAAKSNPLLRARRIYHKFASAAFNQKKPRPMRDAVAKAGYVDILQGVGGAVVRPEFFDEIAFDIPGVVIGNAGIEKDSYLASC